MTTRYRVAALFIDAAGKRRFFAVLHTPQIDGPRKAVAAAIVAEARAK